MQRRRFRYILYLMPALMDCITGIFMFIGPVRAVLLGYDPLVAGSVVSVRSVCCCLTSFFISRRLRAGNATLFMFCGNILLFLACIMGVGAVNMTMIYITSGLSGAAMVTFATSFQVFAKAVDSGESRSVARVAGSYTLSWCLGMSLGPFITGVLMYIGKPADGQGLSIGWIYTYLVAAALSVGLFAGFLWVRKSTRVFMQSHRESRAARASTEGRGKPDLAWLGWFTAIIGVCANGIIRGVFPAGVTRAGMEEWRSGLAMLLLSVAMGGFAYLLSRWNGWFYSARRMALLGVLGVTGLGLYCLPWIFKWGIAQHSMQYYFAALVFGSYSGTTYLYSAYHALIHPAKAGRNISLNETSIAAGMMVGPLLGGWVAKEYGFFPPFVVAAVLVVFVAVVQVVVHGRTRE